MECHRCNGFMVEEWCTDLLDEAFVWRCVNCGAMVDGVIERNNNRPLAAKRPELAAVLIA